MSRKLLLGLTGVAAFVSTTIHAGTMGDMQTAPRGGWVIGGDIGYGYLNTQNADILAPLANTTPTDPSLLSQDRDIGNLVGGAYLGYSIPVFEKVTLGLEAGYKYLGQSKYDSNYYDLIFGNFLTNNIKVNQQAVDMLVTGRLYIRPDISLIGKVGAAYVRSQTKDYNTFLLGDVASNLYTDASIWRIEPEASVGVGYAVKSNMDLNLMYTHIGGTDGTVNGAVRFYNPGPDRLPAVFGYNALTLGVSYTFG